MSIVAGDVIRVSARMRHNVAGDIVNVFYWKASGSGTISNTDFMVGVEAKLNTLYATIAGHLTNVMALFDIKADRVEFIGGKETIVESIGLVSWSGSGAPSGSGEPLPEAVSAIVNLKTGSPGVQGRKFLGVPLEGSIINGDIGGSFGTALTNWIAELLTDWTTTTMTYHIGVMSKKLSGFVAILEGVVRGWVGYQRRRVRRVGA